MTFNPNPLEPWRPSAKQPPPPERKPYLPPGEVWEAGPPRSNPPPRGMRGDRWLVAILWLNLFLLSLIAFNQLPPNHAPQIISVGVLIGLGLTLGISVACTQHWILRVVLGLAGLGAAAPAWWFVPTTGGLS